MEQCPCPAVFFCNHNRMKGISKEMQFSSGRVVTALRQLSTICWMAAVAASRAPNLPRDPQRYEMKQTA
jgi:hypothetical protein